MSRIEIEIEIENRHTYTYIHACIHKYIHSTFMEFMILYAPRNSGPDKHKPTSSNNQGKWLKLQGDRRKDKGYFGGSITFKVVCEELRVTKLCVKDGV